MVLSNAIIFISVVFVCRQRRSEKLWLSAQSESILLVEVHGRRALLSAGRFFNLLCRSCLDALNIIIIFFSNFYFSFPAQILEPKNLFCDSNVSQPYL